MKTPRACPSIWRTKNGKYLFWYHDHSDASRGGWTDRNPAWVSGGIGRYGCIHWSQPEILLYDPNPAMKMSYPDLIEQDGRYSGTVGDVSGSGELRLTPSLREGIKKLRIYNRFFRTSEAIANFHAGP